MYKTAEICLFSAFLGNGWHMTPSGTGKGVPSDFGPSDFVRFVWG